MSLKTEIPADEPIIVMSRIYDAPRELVWQAITEPHHVRAWWGGTGASNPICEMDVRPGGFWTHVIRLPNGHELEMKFQFISVQKPERLVWRDATNEASQAPSPTIDITLEAQGNQTLWTMEARFASLEARDAAVAMGFTHPIAASSDLLTIYLLKMKESA